LFVSEMIRKEIVSFIDCSFGKEQKSNELGLYPL
jgi:hypothetical protein